MSDMMKQLYERGATGLDMSPGDSLAYWAHGRILELERENAALRADKERLDWLEATEGFDGDRDHPYFRRSRTIGAILDDGDVDTIRDAIDKARGLPYKRPSLDHFDY